MSALTYFEGIRDDFGEDRLLEGSGVRVAQIFQEVLEVNPGFAHVGILSTNPT